MNSNELYSLIFNQWKTLSENNKCNLINFIGLLAKYYSENDQFLNEKYLADTYNNEYYDKEQFLSLLPKELSTKIKNKIEKQKQNNIKNNIKIIIDGLISDTISNIFKEMRYSTINLKSINIVYNLFNDIFTKEKYNTFRNFNKMEMFTKRISGIWISSKIYNHSISMKTIIITVKANIENHYYSAEYQVYFKNDLLMTEKIYDEYV